MCLTLFHKRKALQVNFTVLVLKLYVHLAPSIQKRRSDFEVHIKKLRKACECVVVLGLVTRLNCTNQAVLVFYSYLVLAGWGGGRLVKRVGVELVLSLMSFSPFSIPSHSHFCGEITFILLLRSRRSLLLIILVLLTLVLDNHRRGHEKRVLRATKTISYSPGVELILNSLKKLFLK